jgi:lipopolysaccharide biosynthesis glycosyltransferase
VFKREKNPLQSTEFSFSRFLVPWLCGYQGWALFSDCDMLVLDDIASLWAMRDERHAVLVVQHEHVPVETTKFLGAPQSKYGKKNWSSVMLMNCAACKALTPEYVNTATGLELHQFKWLENDALIGALPSRWNHLVGYDAPRKDAALVHFTIGGPYFDEYRDCEYSAEWFRERDAMLRAAQRQA